MALCWSLGLTVRATCVMRIWGARCEGRAKAGGPYIRCTSKEAKDSQRPMRLESVKKVLTANHSSSQKHPRISHAFVKSSGMIPLTSKILSEIHLIIFLS